MSLATLSTRWPGLGMSFNDFFEPWNDWMQDGSLMFNRVLSVPRVNIAEEKNSYNLSLAAPGMTKKDFNISVEGNMVTISAKKEESREEKDKNYNRKEYNFSSFSRSFTLPEDVETDKIDAAYEDGILKLTLPKNEKTTKKLQKAISVR